jgi:hypothetical protein
VLAGLLKSPLVTSRLRRVAASALSVVALSIPLTVAAATPADAASYHYKDCTALHRDFKHGVGKTNARDHHSRTSKAVTNFKRSTRIYNIAVKYHSDLDRDKDGIACEQR